MPRRQSRSSVRTRLFATVAVAAVGISLLLFAVDALRSTELSALDARFSIRGTTTPPPELVLVAIDDRTFDALPDERWPFRRSLHARVIDRIHAGDPSVIVYDVQFTEASGDTGQAIAEDNALIEAVRRAAPVVLATTEVGERGETRVFGGIEGQRHARALVGSANLPTDPGGVNRRVGYEVDGLRTMAVISAGTARGQRLPRSAMGDDPAWIDFHGPPGTIPAISFSDVLEGRVPARRFHNKVVVVGPAAPSLQDVHPTSTTGHGLMSGAELQASAVSTALRGFPLRDAPVALDALLIVLLGLVAPAASWKLGAGRAMLVALGAAAVFVVIAQVAFSAGLVLAVATPLLALVLGAVGALMANYLLATIQREQTRAMFSRFVPDAVVDQMLSGSGRPALPEAVRLECTILFCDLRGFTTFAEDLPPARVVELLNRYLGSMTEAVLDNHGTLAGYMGDGLMAIFGAPLARSEHADDAMRAVRDMLRRMEEFNRWMDRQGLGPGFDIGIGLNSGPVMAGNVGSERRLEYTAIGDTVNTASRLEALTKGTPYAVFLSESTYRLVEHERADLEFAGEFDVRGRRSRVNLWGLRRPDWGRVRPPTGERRVEPGAVEAVAQPEAAAGAEPEPESGRSG